MSANRYRNSRSTSCGAVGSHQERRDGRHRLDGDWIEIRPRLQTSNNGDDRTRVGCRGRHRRANAQTLILSGDPDFRRRGSPGRA